MSTGPLDLFFKNVIRHAFCIWSSLVSAQTPMWSTRAFFFKNWGIDHSALQIWAQWISQFETQIKTQNFKLETQIKTQNSNWNSKLKIRNSNQNLKLKLNLETQFIMWTTKLLFCNSSCESQIYHVNHKIIILQFIMWITNSSRESQFCDFTPKSIAIYRKQTTVCLHDYPFNT